jgi:hypothetical protein
MRTIAPAMLLLRARLASACEIAFAGLSMSFRDSHRSR